MRALHIIFAAVMVMSLAAAADAQAQHEGHQTPAATAPEPRNQDCALAGQKALRFVEAADARLETARRATAAELQDAMTELQMAVAAAQAELFTCRAAVPTTSAGPTPPAAMARMDHSTMNRSAPAAVARPPAPGAKPADAMAGMDHSKMNVGTRAPGAKPVAARGAKSADAMAGVDHSKMNMDKPASGVKSPAAGVKPAAPRPTAPMAGMDHAKMPIGATAKPGGVPTAVAGEAKLPVMMAERIADPTCAGNVGQATAPKAVFERKVYYFCSSAARDEFRKDPVAYLKKHPR